MRSVSTATASWSRWAAPPIPRRSARPARRCLRRRARGDAAGGRGNDRPRPDMRRRLDRSRVRSAASISGAAPTARVASSSTCPIRTPMSTSASRATRSSSTFSIRRCRIRCKRRLDVSDFATPVTTSPRASRATTRASSSSRVGLWEHNAYQSDTRFVLEVRPVKEDPQRLFQGTRQGYQGERLSLNFQNVDVRSLLQVIADFTNLNIITSDSVGGTITLRLKDVPWDQALDIILQTKGLDMRKNGNVLLVAPRDEIATKEKLELESRNQIAGTRAAALRGVRRQLPEGRRGAPPAGRRTAAPAVEARHRGGRSAHQPAVRAGHRGPTRGSPPPDPAHRHPRCRRC